MNHFWNCVITMGALFSGPAVPSPRVRAQMLLFEPGEALAIPPTAIPNTDIQNLRRVSRNEYAGSSNLGLFEGYWRDRRVFIKIPCADFLAFTVQEIFANCVAERLGFGPPLLGITVIEGRVGFVSAHVPGRHLHLFELDRSPGSEASRARAMISTLRQIGIDPNDVQYRLDDSGKYWMVDFGQFVIHAPELVRELERFYGTFPVLTDHVRPDRLLPAPPP